ncbi:Acyl transferase/acyl hydrolase/lysophospholipase [Penicillium argentinense]|uniref:Acyl transferase/acyl hydrolase/lysophospholipase n=1 Tax=Penicillium argentinense TaxID=1131581 RepID=A0A9W9KEL5_9EURO|nr:Acyl transferase/acyl hydrolase/lysophospholipase [Penicillium argentinense]KAJ5102991.1 Acyl transferase/acyl hydrolase/lysophospholipase [Penicillium argentinense]
MRPWPEDTRDDQGGTVTDVMEPIAIVGLAARFPQQAVSVEALWETLLQCRSTWSPIPKERFNADAFYHPDPEHGGTFYIQGGHFLSEDPALFDSSFFNMTKNEVLTLDPQQRLVMENVYHALENAGIPMARAVGSNTSVFVSGFNHDYMGILQADPETALKYKPTGVMNAILSNRVSWFFDFKGPSMTIDTACSSSLVALHLAVQSLRSRETTMSVVSGVSVLENPAETIWMSHHGLLGAQGRSFSFDERAEGYARGEGVGTVILKPLHAAVRDGDVIRAVIRETGVNQDGRTPGITVPSGEAQERLVRDVYRRAGLDMKHTRYVEAHGTGTRTGDPIEVQALARAFNSQSRSPLHIGSIKATLGHLEGGSGVASLIKSVLILESGVIPGNFDLQEINSEISVTDWNISFPSESIFWPTTGLRRVSVNSFGIGGTNAHCVLDDAYNFLTQREISGTHNTVPGMISHENHSQFLLLPRSKQLSDSEDLGYESHSDDTVSEVDFTETPAAQSRVVSRAASPQPKQTHVQERPKEIPHILLLTAFDEDGIKRNAAAYSHYLKCKSQGIENDHLLDDLSLTTSSRRSLFPWKSFAMASTSKELQWNLSEGNFTKPTRADSPPDIWFVFTGQGAQYHGMGKALFAYSVFRNSLAEASEYIRSLGSPWSLLEEHLADGQRSRVDIPEIAQPLCTALQIALTDLLSSWGIFPKAVTGHSSGELAAAYCAGKISRESAWKIAYLRGCLSSKQQSASAAMMAVGMSASDLEPYLTSVRECFPGEIRIACYNSPTNNTVSGDSALIDELEGVLAQNGIYACKLKVRNAYHSAHMMNIADEYLQLMGSLESGRKMILPHPVRMFSTLEAGEVTGDFLPASYWVANMVSPVRFVACLKAINENMKDNSPSGNDLSFIVEIGPHATLQSAIKDTLSTEFSQGKLKYLSVLKRNDPTLNPLLSSIGFLAAAGYMIDLHRVNTASSYRPRKPAEPLVDLPSYSFKHTEKVIHESRLSKGLRFRKFVRHDLFGAPVPDWNANAPRWRHFIRLEENPWIRDHMVTGNYVYPGVGYLVMVIEASRQLMGSKELSGFQLRQVSIRKALVIPDTKQGVEVCLSMTAGPSTDLRRFYRFQISSYNENSEDWTEHCSGIVLVEKKLPLDPVASAFVEKVDTQCMAKDLKKFQSVCNQTIDFARTYSNLISVGLEFGPLFRNLNTVRTTRSRRGWMTGTVTVPDIAQSMPKRYMHQHLIHPATMDSMIHMMIAAMLDITGTDSVDDIRLPTYIRDMWVSADLKSTPGYTFGGYASVQSSASDKFEGQIRIYDIVSQAHLIRMDGIELSPLETGIVNNFERRICTTIDWKPDVHFLDSETACSVSNVSHRDHEKDRFRVKNLQLATTLFMADALQNLSGLDIAGLPSHLLRFYDWMQHVQDELVNDRITQVKHATFKLAFANNQLKQAIFAEVESYNAEGAITVRMGRNIASVIRQEIDPLHLMFAEDSLMKEVYQEGLQLRDLPQHLRSYLFLLRHQCSLLKVLEVGGGTGSFTAEILSVLSPNADPLRESIASYTFTDISTGFFEKARERFHAWKKIMKFQALNIENNPASQGFEPDTYDLIFAGNVIHATTNLSGTLRGLRSLLRPGGQLIIQEGIRQDFLWYPLVFGLLPGWWCGNEPIRKWCPYIPACEWDALLVESGFSGVDIEYPSSDDKDLSWLSIMVSTALDVQEKRFRNVYILSSDNERSLDIVDCITQLLEVDGQSCVMALKPIDLDRVDFGDSLCISLLDLYQPFLSSMQKGDYRSIKKMLLYCPNLLWVTPDQRDNPFSSMSMGLLRTVRWEKDAYDSNIVTLAVADQLNVAAEDLSVWICGIVKHQFENQYEKGRHAEYLLQNHIVHIGHLREFVSADDFLSMQSAPQGDIGHSKSSLHLENLQPTAKRSRGLRNIRHDRQKLSDDQVQVEARAVGLRPNIPSTGAPVEGAGIVSKIGCAVKDLAVGDKVVFLADGLSGNFSQASARINQGSAVRVPDSIPFEVAASLPTAFVTALYGLGEIARLSPSDTVLIHSGADAVGQAAIQYAQFIGAKIYTMVSTVESQQLLVSEYGIPEERIFSSNSLNFALGILKCTSDDGVDVVFNTLTGEARTETLSCVAACGHFVDASTKSLSNSTMEIVPTHRAVSISNIDIALLVRHRPGVVKRLIETTLALYSKGMLGQVIPVNFLELNDLKHGMQALPEEKRAGAAVFIPNPADFPPTPEPFPPLQFDSGASYILAGGLGGLGRSIARWMAKRGAKSLIFLSRTGRCNGPVNEMVADLKAMGCSAHIFACNILDRTRLRAVVGACYSRLPPIKGCIQGSMVLQDGAFEGMSFANWKTAIEPKVQGSWNLHELLPRNMEFFVMLSSVAGIFGNRGQANYAAGNTFQDALAAYRTARGLKASVINLGGVSNIGWVAENRDTLTTHPATLFELLKEDEVHSAIEFMIDDRYKKEEDWSGQPQSQLVLGLPTAEISRQNGVSPPSYLEYSLFTHQRATAELCKDGEEEKKTANTVTLLMATNTFDEAVAVVSDGIVERLSSLLATPISEIDAQKFGLGAIDSLVAMEFRSWIIKELKAEVSVLDIMGAQNIRSLSEKIVGSRRGCEQVREAFTTYDLGRIFASKKDE